VSEEEGRALVASAYPQWRDAHVGTDGLWHASMPPGPGTTPGGRLTGESPQDLLDQIRRFEALRYF
jgi:hypothetical protein